MSFLFNPCDPCCGNCSGFCCDNFGPPLIVTMFNAGCHDGETVTLVWDPDNSWWYGVHGPDATFPESRWTFRCTPPGCSCTDFRVTVEWPEVPYTDTDVGPNLAPGDCVCSPAFVVVSGLRDYVYVAGVPVLCDSTMYVVMTE